LATHADHGSNDGSGQLHSGLSYALTVNSTVSFVIPAWNEEAQLPSTLDAVHGAGRAASLSFEVLVADDASTDGTADVARAHGAIVVPCNNRQIAATRNAGARASTGEILIFVDADTRPRPETVRGVVDAISNGATYGGADVEWDCKLSLISRVLLRSTLNFYRRAKLASGAFLFCTRDAFNQTGGFDESLFAAEEYYFSRALGRIGRHAWVKHRVVTSGRKLRTYSDWELLRETLRLMLRGKKGLRTRAGLDLWYGHRRPDPMD